MLLNEYISNRFAWCKAMNKAVELELAKIQILMKDQPFERGICNNEEKKLVFQVMQKMKKKKKGKKEVNNAG